jgi:hypothetical protein
MGGVTSEIVVKNRSQMVAPKKRKEERVNEKNTKKVLFAYID